MRMTSGVDMQTAAEKYSFILVERLHGIAQTISITYPFILILFYLLASKMPLYTYTQPVDGGSDDGARQHDERLH